MRVYFVDVGKFIVRDNEFEKYLGEYKLIRGVKKEKVRELTGDELTKAAVLEDLKICGKVVDWLSDDIHRIIDIFNE